MIRVFSLTGGKIFTIASTALEIFIEQGGKLNGGKETTRFGNG